VAPVPIGLSLVHRCGEHWHEPARHDERPRLLGPGPTGIASDARRACGPAQLSPTTPLPTEAVEPGGWRASRLVARASAALRSSAQLCRGGRSGHRRRRRGVTVHHLAREVRRALPSDVNERPLTALPHAAHIAGRCARGCRCRPRWGRASIARSLPHASRSGDVRACDAIWSPLPGRALLVFALVTAVSLGPQTNPTRAQHRVAVDVRASAGQSAPVESMGREPATTKEAAPSPWWRSAGAIAAAALFAGALALALIGPGSRERLPGRRRNEDCG
jgi:hypothetical protein